MILGEGFEFDEEIGFEFGDHGEHFLHFLFDFHVQCFIHF